MREGEGADRVSCLVGEEEGVVDGIESEEKVSVIPSGVRDGEDVSTGPRVLFQSCHEGCLQGRSVVVVVCLYICIFGCLFVWLLLYICLFICLFVVVVVVVVVVYSPSRCH